MIDIFYILIIYNYQFLCFQLILFLFFHPYITLSNTIYLHSNFYYWFLLSLFNYMTSTTKIYTEFSKFSYQRDSRLTKSQIL
jgi:hypothetical protein